MFKIRSRCSVVKLLVISILVASGFFAHSQTPEKDTLGTNKKVVKLQNSFSFYTRLISDTKGNKRLDENLLCDFRMLNWLKLELGIRQGERPKHFAAYYGYKIELSTKFLYNKFRILLRLSDNVINYFPPSYRRTNEMAIAEYKLPFSKRFQLKTGAGYLFSWKQNKPDALPTNEGVSTHFPVFKLALRYNNKRHMAYEINYGSYDVFNPYLYNQPIAQISVDKEFRDKFTLFSYFRYQYDHKVFKPLNYFFALGFKMNLNK